MIIHCCACGSEQMNMTDQTVKLTIDSDIGGGDSIPITAEYRVLQCRVCNRKQWLDVKGFCHFLSGNPPKLDAQYTLTSRGVFNG